ncbi:hypothetical protein AGMMS50229_03990 [Campylobacterota bacterium]|nr:hypothetical protein AGMMS50229_03990 [Campylobacterota bacterium]
MQNNESKRRSATSKLNLSLLAITAVVIALLTLYYVASPSYIDSRDAKALFAAGRYQEALNAAEITYAENPYNIMAYSIVEQSKLALNYERYIADAAKYKIEIDDLINDHSNQIDRMKLKMLLEAMIFDYARLGEAGYKTPPHLSKEADEYNRAFTDAYARLFKNAR